MNLRNVLHSFLLLPHLYDSMPETTNGVSNRFPYGFLNGRIG